MTRSGCHLAGIIKCLASRTCRKRPEWRDECRGHALKTLDGPTRCRSCQSDVAIRVWGLDAPERKQAGGSEATRAMRSLISGATLDCRVRDIDRYDRLVAQCFLPDGRDIAAEMIYMGVATEYCRYSGGFYGTC